VCVGVCVDVCVWCVYVCVCVCVWLFGEWKRNAYRVLVL